MVAEHTWNRSSKVGGGKLFRKKSGNASHVFPVESHPDRDTQLRGLSTDDVLRNERRNKTCKQNFLFVRDLILLQLAQAVGFVVGGAHLWDQFTVRLKLIVHLFAFEEQLLGNKPMEFISEVLKFSVKDIMNENLLKNKVQPIPVRFASLSKYLEVFKDPLVEEIRAQLQQSLEGIRSSSYISLERVEEKPLKNDPDTDQLKRFLLLKDLDANMEDRDGKKKLSWTPKPTDLILLTTLLPQTDYRELERSGACYTFGLLKSGGKDDDSILSVLYAPSESREYTSLKDETCKWYALQMGTMATGIRIADALERSMPDEMDIWQERKGPLLECLYTESTLERGLDDLDGGSLFVDGSVPDQNPEIIASYCRYRGLNESQATAVTTVVYGLLQRQRPYIRLIQGPPGTGKTFTLATLFSILSCLKQRVLVCASTNVAVSEVALRFLEFFDVPNARKKAISTQYGQFLELSNMGIESSTLSSITLGDVVLIGNDNRLDVEGPLGQLYLDSRVDRLQRALSTITGWRASVTSILEFLKSASSQFDTYKERNEADKSGFAQFFRMKLTKLAENLVDNHRVLSADLPSKIFAARSREIFQSLSTEISRFVDLVTRTSLEEAEAYLLFQESSSFQSALDFSSSIQHLLTDTGAEILEAVDELKAALSTSVRHLNEILEVPVQPTREWVQANCLEHAWLVFSTVSSSGRQILLRSKPFECVIVDEAAQCVEAETTIVTSMNGVKQVVLVGDHMQLPATVISQVSRDCGYARSLFERLQSLGHPMNLLNVQYRMHPSISMFPNMQFYNGKVEDGANVMKSVYGRACYQKQLFGPYTFINVHDGNEERDEDASKSWKNPVEAAIVVHLVSKISAVCRDAKAENVSIGVISPYQSQVKELEKMLSRYDNMPRITVEVKSVDGFQGREKDIILFSTVRSNSGGHIGFLKDYRRLNVAITRAKHCLWVIGNERTLSSRDEVWKALVNDAKERKCITNPGDHPVMTKLIRHVKEELNQLAELLNPNSVLFNGTMWKVLFAKEMKTTFSQVTSTAIRQQFLNKMLNLANGRRSSYPTTSELASLRYRKLIQVQPVADFYLVWTVDIENGQTPKQIIKVWNAVRDVDLARLVRRLEGGYSTCTDIYLERCAKKLYDTSFGSTKKLVIPANWKWDASFVKFKSLERKDRAPAALNVEETVAEYAPILEKSAVDESVLLMKFYPLSSGVARQLLTASDGSQFALPFEVNEQEAAIIQYQRSSFIIGRSGTGKTTVITTKLLQREHDFWIAMNSIPRIDNDPDKDCASSKVAGSLKQVFITLSPKLCAAVKHNISKTRKSMQEVAGGVVDGESSDQYEDNMMLDDEAEAKLMGSIPDSFANVPSDCYPLVITYRKFLSMLDGSVSEPFFPSRMQEPREIFDPRVNLDTTEANETEDLNAGHASSHEVINSDSEQEYEDLCSDFSDENLSEDENISVEHNRDKPRGASVSVRNFRVTEVDFEGFESTYWPHFNSRLTKHLDSSLVYTEIMSHIKGSVEALHSPIGFLSREDYISLVTRRTSLYTEEQREDIYSLFLQYEKRKRANGEYDAADLVTHLYAQLRDDNYLGEKMHFVYVDEVQDFTQAQIALFKFISDKLEDGFLFAGDTAQTIARGVGFRFEDIRRLFYEEFIGKKCSGQELSHCGSRSVSSGMKVPDLFQLSINFRTHMGVVGIANSVVQLLHHYFPQSIDKLDLESSLLQGEIPVFLKTQENRGMVTSLFDTGGITGGGGCEFGAEQVILVRDSAAKNYLVRQLGQRGLVLTVHECKGLEFQDVLLYNFFTDSPLQNKWRVISGFMEAQNLVSREKYAYPGFDVKRHNVLCNELKQLYVGLTRARQRLWIYDECVEHHQPMLDYWKASGLVQVKQLDASLAVELQGKSSPEDWKKIGIKMFNERHFDAAMLCFDRAGDSARAQHAKAAGFEQAAMQLQRINVKKSACLLREAAELFISLKKGDAAVKCYIKLGDFKKAGSIYLEICNPPKLEEAGDCFSEAKCWEEAAHAFFGVNMTKCLSMCWRGKLLDLGMSFIQIWESERKRHIKSNAVLVNSSDRTAQHRDSQQLQRLQVSNPLNEKLDFERIKIDFIKKAASLYHQSKNVTEMMKFVLMFPSLAMRRSFLKRRDCDEQLELIEEDAGNLERAAELAESRGDLRRAAKLLERSGLISLAVEKLLHAVTMELRWGNAEDRALVQQDLEDASAMANQDNSGVCEALVHETRILMHKTLTENPYSSKLDIFKEIWIQVQKLNVVRLELLSSHVLLQEILKKLRRSFEEMENTNIEEFCRAIRELLPDLIEVWNHWSKLMVLNVRTIERSQKGRGRDEDELILESVYLHMGVRKHSQHDSLLVENRNMRWLESREDISANHAVKRGSLSIREFSGLAFEYFSTQIYALGIDELFSLLERIHRRLGTKDDSKLPTIGFIRILMFSFNILSTVLELRTWEAGLNSKIDAAILDCSRHLYDFFFLTLPAGSLKELQVARELPDASPVFERLAEDLSSRKPLTFDGMGRLVTLHLFLGREWAHGKPFNSIKNMKIENYHGTIFKDCLWRATHWHHSETLKSTQREQNMGMDKCSFWSNNLSTYIYALRFVFRKVDFRKARGYISPFVYLALLERGIVAAGACTTHLKSMIISENMALYYMSGKHHEPYYSMLLNCTCDGGCNQVLSGVLFEAVKIITELLFEVLELKEWLCLSEMDPKISLPPVVLRLLKLLITICINIPHEFIHEHVIKSLTILFEEKSPVLAELPVQFFKDFEQLFINSKTQSVSISRLVSAFASAMRSVDDRLVILRKTGRQFAAHMSWHDGALKKLKLATVMVNQVRPSEFSLTSLEQNPAPRLDNPNIQKSVNNAGTKNSNFGTPISNLQDQIRLSTINDTLEEDAHENVVVSTIVGESSYSSFADTIEGTWRPDVTDISTSKPAIEIIPYSKTSDAVRLVDGTTFSRRFVEQLQLLLKAARERIAVPLTPLESYQRQARSVFLRRGICDNRYLGLFVSEACLLQVEVFECLTSLNKALEYIKGGQIKLDNGEELLEKFSEQKEELEEAFAHLNPKAVKHEEEDLDWLENNIRSLRSLLENGQSQLQGFREVVDAQSPLHPSTKSKSRREESQISQKGKKTQQKKQKKKNKKKNW